MPIVVDANVFVALAIPHPDSAAAVERVRDWLEQREVLVSPALWEYEATSSIRKYAALRSPPPEEISAALGVLASAPVISVASDPELRRAALDWAERLGQHSAYDAFYVALAERLETELWTVDRRLANGCRAAGASFVRALPDPAPPYPSRV